MFVLFGHVKTTKSKLVEQASVLLSGQIINKKHSTLNRSAIRLLAFITKASTRPVGIMFLGTP